YWLQLSPQSPAAEAPRSASFGSAPAVIIVIAIYAPVIAVVVAIAVVTLPEITIIPASVPAAVVAVMIVALRIPGALVPDSAFVPIVRFGKCATRDCQHQCSCRHYGFPAFHIILRSLLLRDSIRERHGRPY